MPKINQKNNGMTLKEFQNVGTSGGGGKYYVEKADPIYLRKDEVKLKQQLKGNLYENVGQLGDYPQLQLKNQNKPRKNKNMGPVQVYSVKTRQGFIPGQKKTNQDSFVVHNNFADI